MIWATLMWWTRTGAQGKVVAVIRHVWQQRSGMRSRATFIHVQIITLVVGGSRVRIKRKSSSIDSLQATTLLTSFIVFLMIRVLNASTWLSGQPVWHFSIKTSYGMKNVLHLLIAQLFVIYGEAGTVELRGGRKAPSLFSGVLPDFHLP